MSYWFVIGISGVTCGGKSSLADALLDFFTNNKNLQIVGKNLLIGDAVLIRQDNYFLPKDSPKHSWIDELNHINWEILDALDTDKMITDIRNVLKDDFALYHKNLRDNSSMTTFQNTFKVNILIIEGFLIFNQPQLLRLSLIKFHIHLPFEKCFERRKARVYDPPDVTGYFEMCVWPMYEMHFRKFRDNKDIIMLNGEIPKERIFKYALNCIINAL